MQAYVDIRRDEEFVRLAGNDVDRLSETLRATQNRFEVGEVTRTDVSQAESRRAASDLQLAAAVGALEVSRENYRQAVGVPARNLEPLPPLPPLVASLDEATRIGLQRNPRIVSAQFAERSAVYDFDRALAAKGLSVGVSVGGGFERDNNTQGETGVRWNSDLGLEAGIEATVPLYSGGRNDSLVRQAQALLEQRRFQLQDEGRAVTQEVAAAWSELDVARASIVARREQERAAQIASEGVAEEARLGARSTLDVLDADQELLQAQAEVVQALRDEYVAAYNVKRQPVLPDKATPTLRGDGRPAWRADRTGSCRPTAGSRTTPSPPSCKTPDRYHRRRRRPAAAGGRRGARRDLGAHRLAEKLAQPLGGVAAAEREQSVAGGIDVEPGLRRAHHDSSASAA